MKNILVAADFSPASKNAYNYALLLAQEWKASLTVLHVMLPITNNGTFPPEIIAYANTNQEEEAKQKLKQLTRFYPNEDASKMIEHNLNINHRVEHGTFVPTILDVAKTMEADLIIAGAKPRTAISNAILGSVATALTTQTSVPLLLIPENHVYKPIKNMAVATDLDKVSDALRERINALAVDMHADLHPFFINPMPNDFFDKKEEEWLSTETAFGKEKIGTLTVIRDKFVTSGIDYYLEKHPAEILLMIKPKRDFWQRLFHVSTTKQMVAKSTIPLLVLPSNE